MRLVAAAVVGLQRVVAGAAGELVAAAAADDAGRCRSRRGRRAGPDPPSNGVVTGPAVEAVDGLVAVEMRS